MRRHLLAAALVSAAFASGGCYPDRFDGTNYDLIASTHDSTGNFHATTYALKDTVVHLTDPGLGDNVTRTLDPTILATVRTNMNNAGYTEIAGAAGQTTADLRLVAAVSSNEYTQYYWDYYCGIYWYGCYYPPYYSSYTYTTGSLFVAMQDRRVPPVNAKQPLIWLSIANGLMNSAPSAARVTSAINTMFTQSPYIDATP
jgi:hypothetical protein